MSRMRAQSFSTICSLCVMMVMCCFLEVNGQQASLMTPQSPVSEGIGSVSVCVNVTNADSIPNGGVTIEVSTTTLGSNPATPNVDYRLEQEVLTFMPGTTLNCTSISLIDDDLVEGNTPEDIFVRIQSPDQQLITINTDSDIAIISIEDNDRLVVGFTQSSYSVQEDFGSFELCTRTENGQIAPELDPITIDISIEGGTAQNNDDYLINSSATYSFSNTTSTLSCIPVRIVDDGLVETNETLTLRLSETTNLVDFTVVNAEISIEDDDFATVIIDPRQLTIVEGNDTMNTTRELCAVLNGVGGGLQREVMVNINVTEYTATATNDFALMSDSVSFQNNARVNDRACFDILIIGDNIIETDEIFLVNLSTVFLDRLGNPSSATVTISHDGDGLCSTLQAPTNGDISLTGNEPGSTANYSCIINYELVGPETRECMADIGWSSRDPLCLRQCRPLGIDNGNVVTDVGQYVEGAVATYTCNFGYRLNSNLKRVCQRSGQWNGSTPSCQEINCGDLGDPQNGRVRFDSTRLGAMATYSCNNGFELQGSPVAMCGSNGLWTRNPPLCSGAVVANSVSGMMLTLTVSFVMLLAQLS